MDNGRQKCLCDSKQKDGGVEAATRAADSVSFVSMKHCVNTHSSFEIDGH